MFFSSDEQCKFSNKSELQVNETNIENVKCGTNVLLPSVQEVVTNFIS